MAQARGSTANVEQFPGACLSNSVGEELTGILEMLRQAFPDAAHISLGFDGKLHAYVDLRKREQVTLVEATLPTLGAGKFHDAKIGSTPNHPFLHRVSALVRV